MSVHQEKFREHIEKDQAFCARFAEKKNGLDYINWSNMWAATVAAYDAVEYEDEVRQVGASGYEVRVRARVRIGDEWSSWSLAALAVTNHANKVIAEPTSADIQNTRQRALAKALSMATGRGLTLWMR